MKALKSFSFLAEQKKCKKCGSFLTQNDSYLEKTLCVKCESAKRVKQNNWALHAIAIGMAGKLIYEAGRKLLK
jgi:hypothetical protein